MDEQLLQQSSWTKPKVVTNKGYGLLFPLLQQKLLFCWIRRCTSYCISNLSFTLPARMPLFRSNFSCSTLVFFLLLLSFQSMFALVLCWMDAEEFQHSTRQFQRNFCSNEPTTTTKTSSSWSSIYDLYSGGGGGGRKLADCFCCWGILLGTTSIFMVTS